MGVSNGRLSSLDSSGAIPDIASVSDVLAEILNDSMTVLSFFDGESYHIYGVSIFI